jgi:hypothetical protein
MVEDLTRWLDVKKSTDVVNYVKRLAQVGYLAEQLEFHFDLWNDKWEHAGYFVYANMNVDKMIEHLFDLSLNSTISSIIAKFGAPWQVADNGARCPVIGFNVRIEPSTDGQTNITPKLVDFMRVVLDPYGLERLKEQFTHHPVWDIKIDTWGTPIPFQVENMDVWKMFEDDE